jgi:Cu-Zn family superoxide dismutase
MHPTRISIAAVGVAIMLALPTLAACGSSGTPSAASAQTPSPATLSPLTPSPPSPSPLPSPTIVLTQVSRYSPTAEAVTYDPARVPVGSAVAVVSVQAAGQTRTVLAVHGLAANHAYGAHAHIDACGKDPDASGSHFQHQADPRPPSVNPDYANPRNEIWLDFTTDAAGSARAESTVDWTFGDGGPKSVVIHAEHTATTPGRAGQAGARLACINL